MQTLSKFSCSLLRQAVVSSALAIPADLKDHSHYGGSLPLTLNLWLIVEFCHKTTSLPQAGHLPRRVTNCQAKQSTGGSKSKLPLPQTAVISGFQMEPATGHTKEKLRSVLSPPDLLKVYSCCFARETQGNSSNSLSSIINKWETIH